MKAFFVTSRKSTGLLLSALSSGHPAAFIRILIDPVSGTSIAEAADSAGDAGSSVYAAAALVIGSTGIIAMSSFILGNVSFFTFTATTMNRVSFSGATWDGRGRPECFTPGEIRDGDADLWICAGHGLWKNVVTMTGLTTLLTEFATFIDSPRYAVWHDSDVIVWTDNAEAIRIDGSTGAVVWTKAVPYQIGAAGSLRSLPGPDEQRLDDELLVQTEDQYYFTSLDTGLTRTVGKATEVSSWRYVYDGLSQTVITTDNIVLPLRRLFDVAGSGALRNLSDLLSDLMVYGGGYDSDQVETVNIDDLIEGSVIDVTAGVRDIARATCEPYSIAIFERSGVIIFKRALTDGAFAVDATLSSAGDIADSAGQAIKARRLNPEEFVSRYGINYRDPDQIYQARPQYGEIPTLPFPVAPADWSVKADIPIIVDADTIKTLATQKVNRMALERHEFTMTLAGQIRRPRAGGHRPLYLCQPGRSRHASPR
jgi:hypothetical protein